MFFLAASRKQHGSLAPFYLLFARATSAFRHLYSPEIKMTDSDSTCRDSVSLSDHPLRRDWFQTRRQDAFR
jgi:hypothetical protein